MPELQQPQTATEKKPLTPEAEEANKKREALQEAYRQWYWDNLKRTSTHFRIRPPEMLGQEEPDESQAAAALTGLSIPQKINAGLYDLVYKEKDEEKTISILVKQNENGYSISPSKTPKSGDFNNCYTQLMRSYSVGLGLNRIELDFPNAEKYPHLINLKDVIRLLKIAQDEKMVITFGPVLLGRLANLDLNNKKDMQLRHTIYDLKNTLERNHQNNKELNAKQEEVNSTFLVKGAHEAATTLKNAGTNLEKAVEGKAPSDEVKEKMKALLEARNTLEKKINNIQKDMQDHPSSKALYEKYERELSKVEKEVTKVKNSLDAIKGSLTGEDLKEYETLLKRLETLEKQAVKVAQQAKIESQTPNERVNTKIDNLGKAHLALNEAVTTYKQDENKLEYTQARDDMREAIKSINNEINKDDLSKTEMERYLREMEDVNKSMETLKAEVALREDGPVKSKVESDLNSLVMESDTVVTSIKNGFAAPEEREAAKITEIEEEQAADEKAHMIADELDTINNRLERLQDKIERLTGKTSLTDDEINKCEKLGEELEKEEKSSNTHKDKWKGLIDKLKRETPPSLPEGTTDSLEAKQQKREGIMGTLQNLKPQLQDAANKKDKPGLKPGPV